MPRCLQVFEPPDGGVAENVRQLALRLRGHGWDAWVAGPREAIIYPELAAAGVPTARLSFRRGYGHPLQDGLALRELVAIMRRRRFDLVHVHSAKAGVLGRVSAYAARTPVIYSPHCFPFVGPWPLPRRAFAIGVERALAPITQKILCVAEQERRLALAQRIAPAHRLTVVHNGSAPCDNALQTDPDLEALRRAGPLAACLTVLRPQKAVHVFIDAVPLVLARMPDAQLAVVGDGELRPALMDQARRLGVDRRLAFVEFKPPVARQLRAIDVFVLSSEWEAFPISVLEAMACGVPQVATDVGGTGEAVEDGETGLLCPPNDPPALAERIVELLSDPARRARMSESARLRHRLHFGLDRMIERTARAYDEVVSAGG